MRRGTAAGSGSQEMWLCWIIATAIISWQLFVPPIIGLADQGDFVRILGPLGYAPKPMGPEHKYLYVTRKFAWDPSYREFRWEQMSSEFITAGIALGLNRILFSAQELDLTILGFVHTVAFYRLIRQFNRLFTIVLITPFFCWSSRMSVMFLTGIPGTPNQHPVFG